MNLQSTLSLLAAQMERAKLRLLRARASGWKADPIQGIVNSLRLSLAAVLGGLDPRRAMPGSFILRVGPDREHAVLLDDQAVSIDAASLKTLFATAGLRLEVGQVLLLDPAVVREILEKDLGQPAIDKSGEEKEPSPTDLGTGTTGTGTAGTSTSGADTTDTSTGEFPRAA